jgi:hypothetical protein
VRHALRALIRQPGFSAAVISILGVGIGVVTVMFASAWGIALRPLPFPEPERLVWIEAVTDAGNPNALSALDYFDYREGSGSLESAATQLVFQPGVVVTGRGEPERAISSVVLSMIGAGVGVGLAALGIRLLKLLGPGERCSQSWPWRSRLPAPFPPGALPGSTRP